MRKVLAATLTCLMALLLAIPSIAQTATPKGKFDVRIKLKSNDCIAKKIVLLVQVKAHDANSTFRLGDANFRFDYDPAVVINPKNISQENFSNAAPANDANYAAQTLTGSKVSTDGKMGIVSLNVLYSGSNAGAKLVGTDYITVACIQFDIVKGDGCVNFKWHNDNPITDFPVTGMNEIIEVTANPYDYNNPVVPAGGVFESYNVCLNTLCANPTVDAINDFFTTNINTAVTGNALTNDIPSTGLTVKTSSLGTPLHGSISMSSTGAFTYTPSTGYVGKDSVQYEACNATNVCDKAYIVINITGPSPVVNRDVYSTNINTAVTGNVLANDTPNGGLTVKISPFPTPLHGSLTLSTNGSFTYTPNTGYVGKDSIQYEACNGNNICQKAWAVFTITGPAPVVNRDIFSTPFGTPVSGNVLTNDTPNGGLTVKISPFPTPLHGSFTFSTNGAFTYTPTAGYVGKDSIQYEACNSANQCAKAWAVFTVTSPAPVAVRDVYSTQINTPVSGNVLMNDTPAGTLTVKISPLPTPLHGGITLSTNGAFTYTPITGYVGKDSIQYEACNTNNQCVKAWTVFTVTGQPNPTVEVDLALIKTTSQKKSIIGDLITYTISLTNHSSNLATGVTVKDYMPAGAMYKSFATSTGTYNPTTGIWTVGNVAAQQTINLMITVQAQAQGTFFNVAEVMTCDQVDKDSKPGNTYTTGNTTNPLLEDDNASACFYVPIEICSGSGDEYDITVPQGYQGIQWYKNGMAINGVTASTLRVNDVGTYTFTTLVGNCPAGGCCPAEFISVDCCKPAICVPYTVIKTKSGRK
jgi:uncharacterized repeat protein (TIGR01451 family)